VDESDDLLLVTSGGQMIRTPVGQVRIVGRASQGVTIFRTAEGERVVSVERLPDSGGEAGANGTEETDEAGADS
jgi:DNA gyrase subunit A